MYVVLTPVMLAVLREVNVPVQLSIHTINVNFVVVDSRVGPLVILGRLFVFRAVWRLGGL